MNEKIFVDDDETAQSFTGFQCLALHKPDRIIQFPAAFYEGYVFPLEKVGGATKVAPVGATETPGDVRHFRLHGIGIDPRRLDRYVGVADRPIQFPFEKSPA